MGRLRTRLRRETREIQSIELGCIPKLSVRRSFSRRRRQSPCLSLGALDEIHALMLGLIIPCLSYWRHNHHRQHRMMSDVLGWRYVSATDLLSAFGNLT
jgi:hypothetical protein